MRWGRDRRSRGRRGVRWGRDRRGVRWGRAEEV